MKDATNEAGRMVLRGFFFAVGAFMFRSILDAVTRNDDDDDGDDWGLVVVERDDED